MLVACRLADLSALGAHYAGVNDAQCGANACIRSPRSVARRAEMRGRSKKVIEVTPKGWADRGAGCAARPLWWCKKEGNGRRRRVGSRGRSERRLTPRRLCAKTPFRASAAAHADIRDGTRPAPAFSRQKPANTHHSWE